MSQSIIQKLQAPFPKESIEWRIQRSGMKANGPWAMVLAYVDARAVQNRLDDAVGCENWQTKYTPVAGGMMCELSLRISGEWVTKTDGSPETDIEGFKGAISKSLVRAASAWGIGRYLYDLPTGWANFVVEGTPGAKKDPIKKTKEDQNPQWYSWLPPELPGWASASAPAASIGPEVAKPAPVSKPVKPKPRTRADIGLEIDTAASKLGLADADVDKWIMDDYKTTLDKLPTEQLEQFLETLRFEVGRQGEIA